MRFNGRGLVSADGLFLEADQVYGNCPKYIQLRRLGPDAETAHAPAPSVSRRLDPDQQSWIANADTFFIGTFHPQGGAEPRSEGTTKDGESPEENGSREQAPLDGNEVTTGSVVYGGLGYRWRALAVAAEAEHRRLTSYSIRVSGRF
jgi:predicted pyridoxine 5'-phosphate oxidase superfamily flavin-nucleotide-binding protein